LINLPSSLSGKYPAPGVDGLLAERVEAGENGAKSGTILGTAGILLLPGPGSSVSMGIASGGLFSVSLSIALVTCGRNLQFIYHGYNC
jgi:hypothetical protein